MSLEWPRAPRETLLAFDPNTKRCTMNCGQHQSDPRSRTEMKFQCDDCVDVTQDPRAAKGIAETERLAKLQPDPKIE